MKPYIVFITGLLWMTVCTKAIPVDVVKKNSDHSKANAVVLEPNIHQNKIEESPSLLNGDVNGRLADAKPIKANSIHLQKDKTTKRKFKAKINYSDDDGVIPLRNKTAHKKQNRTLDLSAIDEVLPDRLKNRYADYVKDGYGKNVEELTNIRRKLKILKKIHGSARTAKVNETSADVDDLLFEGDEQLTEKQLDSIIASTARHYGFDIKPLEKFGIRDHRLKRQAIINPEENDNLWPQGTIYFYYDDNVPTASRNIIKQAFRNIENQTCLSFAANSAATARIQFANKGACSSLVGYIYDGPHVVSIGGCIKEYGPISHEILHALGIHHQHERSDVGDYIEDTSGLNILDDTNSNNFGTPYDYGSVMHYNGLETTDPLHLLTIGLRVGPSFLDIKLLNLRYNCMCENPTVTCLNGGYPNPHDCSSCLCPRGYDSSNRCSGVDPGTENESQEISVTSDECQTFEKSLGTDNDFLNTYYKKAWFQFKAPSGKRVQLIFLKGADKDESEQGGCPDNGIEVKITKSKFDRTGYIFCGNNDKFVSKSIDDIKTFTSSGNMAMLQLFAQKNMIDLIVKYRYVDSANDEIPYSCLPTFECENIAGDEDCELYAGNPDENCDNDPGFMLKYCAKTCEVC